MIYLRVAYDVTGDFDRTTKWLQDVTNGAPKALSQIADQGLQSLQKNTPKDTGATANGWEAIITRDGTGHNIAWVNTAHPNLNVNVALIIELGHGIGTGGYVQPRPYIKQAMDGVFKTAGQTIAKELIK